MEIRRLTERDADALYRLRLHALEMEPSSFRESLEELRQTTVEAYATRLGAGAEDNFVLGAFDGSGLIGMVGFYRELPIKCRHKGVIWGMFVDQPHRRSGIGRALLSGALERAGKLTGLKQIRLTVATTQQAARALYANCGFQSFGTEPKALLVDGEFIDEEQMFLSVAE
jgi:RimJ/RimL family protein N-acetyltransferase